MLFPVESLNRGMVQVKPMGTSLGTGQSNPRYVTDSASHGDSIRVFIYSNAWIYFGKVLIWRLVKIAHLNYACTVAHL